MEFRIGVNLGDVMVDGEQIYGDGVNVAARLESLADPGSIFISGSVHEQLGNKLALGYEDIGEQTVKNIAKPVRVYRVLPETGGAPPRKTRRVARKVSSAGRLLDGRAGDNRRDHHIRAASFLAPAYHHRFDSPNSVPGSAAPQYSFDSRSALYEYER
jgi:adenylate/guanylate cyclase family protein